MPTIYLLCGLPGAGKTTLARRLERELPALRLTEDEWVTGLFPPESAHDDGVRDAIKNVQWETALRAIALGVDVVLDWGLWGRAERDDYRARAAALGVQTKLIYLEVSREELLRRLALRNAALPPDTFHVTERDLDEWTAWFQPPTPDELM
jgi:predicted kinase